MLWKRSNRSLTLRSGACTHVGQVRTENQDAYERFSDGACTEEDGHCLFIVADGMGGHEDGGRASRMAVEIAGKFYFEQEEASAEERFRGAIASANEQVYAWANAGSVPKKMGTTFTAVAFTGNGAWLAHVGDSRAYRVNREGIRQLTRDHTLVDALRREGVLTEDEAQRHPQRHALTRAVGVEPTVEVDIERLAEPEAGDVFVLCSDGLAHVTDAEIRDLVQAEEPQAAAERLVNLANERGGQDNVTVVVIKVK